jgi:hypothetical protein
MKRGNRRGQGAPLPGGQRRQCEVQHGSVGGLPLKDGLLTSLCYGQLDGATVVLGGDAAQHAPGVEGVDDGRDGVGPHVQQVGQLPGPRAGVLGQRRQQFQLRHGQRVPGVGDPRTTPKRTAQPGDCLGQAARPKAGLAIRPVGRDSSGHAHHSASGRGAP